MSIGLEQVTTYADGLDHPEGVTVDALGQVYAGGEAGQVYRVGTDGSVTEVAQTGGFLLGLCADAAGLLYACDVGRREVLRIDPTTGDVDVYSAGSPDRAMVNPNWPAFDAAGNLYVTDSGSWKGNDGCVFRIAPGGQTEVWSTASTDFPNGAALTRDGRALMVLESCAPALVRLPINDDGTSGPREVWAEMPGTVPDGIALCADESSYVFCYRPDRVLHVAVDGTVTTVADDPEGTVLSAPTNGVWVNGLSALVIGSLGRWHLARLEPGRKGISLEYPEVPR